MKNKRTLAENYSQKRYQNNNQTYQKISEQYQRKKQKNAVNCEKKNKK